MIDWGERILCILLSLCILGNALLVRRIVRAWAFPAVLFALAWFAYTIIPLVCFPSAHVYPAAMLYILGATVAVSAASMSTWKTAFATSAIIKAPYRDYYSDRFFLVLFFIGFALSVACLLMNSIVQGISLTQLFTNINDSAAEYAGRRYGYDISSNIYQQSGTVLAYFCAGLGGLIVLSQRNHYMKWGVAISALFPSIFVMISQSAKGMLFLSAAIFLGGILSDRIQHNKTSLFSKRAIPAAIVGLVVTISLVTVSFLSRGMSSVADRDLIDALAPYWASYTSGHLFAFSDWFGNYIGEASAQSYDDPGLTQGFYTFMSIFKLFGDDRYVPNGVYSEYLSIPPYIQTNIYTSFRGMIHDFGLAGSLICIASLSFFAHKAFRSMLISSKPSFSVAAFIFSTAFIYQSFLISSLTWTTLPIGIFLVGIVLYITRFKLNYQAM
ncbi:O-antigen polymerase [Sphingomonas sp. dw_22]|uniref:O-antigen polymerase n=1 Tax=Sphingomonas sp. dw_22 TaxID=2721175 RepID=UPI001BD29B42|nr:O-antigen polymerase [Sphingomonas sp. dw_22]